MIAMNPPAPGVLFTNQREVIEGTIKAEVIFLPKYDRSHRGVWFEEGVAAFGGYRGQIVIVTVSNVVRGGEFMLIGIHEGPEGDGGFLHFQILGESFGIRVA